MKAIIITSILVVALFVGWLVYSVHRNIECKLKGGVLVSGLGDGGFVCVEPVE